MSEHPQDIKPESRLQEAFEQGSIEVAQFAETQIADIDAAVDALIDKTNSLEDRAATLEEKKHLQKKQGEIKSLAARAKESIFFYTRLVVLGGILLKPGDAHISEHHHDETLDEQIHRAKVEMAEKNITSEQASRLSVLNRVIRRGVTPYGYDFSYATKGAVSNLLHNKGSHYGAFSNDTMSYREDAWRLYLGIPQESHTFGISDYQPSHGTEKKYYFKLNGYFEDFLSGNHFSAMDYGETGERKPLSYSLRLLVGAIRFYDQKNQKFIDSDFVRNVMGNFMWSCGTDERGSYIAYYDKWDLDIFPENNKGFFGKPFEIYDRFYYDPITFEPLENMSHN